ncbi:uncharacterized protein LOC109595312 isoform X2 [Aethina tumida]|uniref:uncharacterized protein LOC109595312 isoform X2 n=1 Tax=Aethina tumida TaxID=116153 RepID=UPI00096AF52E|nr:uncharacterized protein LOC109595312 isoform X2 [Aethina tumida]
MYISNIQRKENIRTVALKYLRKHGIKYRAKKRPSGFLQTRASETKKFGVPLSELEVKTVTLINGEQIVVPKILCDMVHFIRNDIGLEGVFRKESTNKKIKELINLIEKNADIPSEYSVYDMAVVLKRFLRNLPESLIPENYRDMFLQCMDLENKKYLIMLACLLLPSESVNVLAYLMPFLQEVSHHELTNKMSPYNLAIVFWPCIIPQTDRSLDSLDVKKLCDIVQLLIGNADNIGIIPDYIINEVGKEENVRKRRSGSLTRMFSGLRKMVVNGKGTHGGDQQTESHLVTPDLLITPSIDRSRNKRRRIDESEGLSARKKREVLDKLPNAALLSTPYTPRTIQRTPVSRNPKKEKKSLWFHRSKSVKNLKDDTEEELKDKIRHSLGPRSMLERSWSQVSHVTSFRRKKRNSCLGLTSQATSTIDVQTETEKVTKPEDEEAAEDPVYLRVSKKDYEKIQNRLSHIERQLLVELDNAQSRQEVLENENNLNSQADKNIENVITAYEQTLEQSEPMSLTTDQLARRLSRELRIRSNSEHKIIRSPSARKIGTLRRRSRELEKKNHKKVVRHQSLNETGSTMIPRVQLRKSKDESFSERPAEVHKPVTRSSSFQTVIGSNNSSQISCNTSGSSVNNWVCADTYFKTPVNEANTLSVNGRASVAKLRSQNAGMVLAKARLFDNLQDSDSSLGLSKGQPQRTTEQSKPTVNKIGAPRTTHDNRMSSRLRSLRLDEKKKSTSPRRRNVNVSQRQRLQMAKQQVEQKNKENTGDERECVTPLRIPGNVNSSKSTPKSMPHIKRNINVRSPKRLCRTPIRVDRKTPLKVLSISGNEI